MGMVGPRVPSWFSLASKSGLPRVAPAPSGLSAVHNILPAKQFQKWHQEEENQDKPDLVKFFNMNKGIFVYRRLTMVGPEGCREDEKKQPKWVSYNPSQEEEEGYEEGVDYI